MTRYQLGSGVRVEPIGQAWAGFAPGTGKTLMLNDEAAACLEVLGEQPGSIEEVARLLSDDTGESVAAIIEVLKGTFELLANAGLIQPCRLATPGDSPTLATS